MIKRILALAFLVSGTTAFAANVGIANPWLSQSLAFHVEWTPNPPAENVTTYRLYYKVPDGTSDWYEFVEFSGSQSSGVLFGMPWAPEYNFILTAVNAGGESQPSEMSRATPEARPGRPGAPQVKKIELTVTISQ